MTERARRLIHDHGYLTMTYVAGHVESPAMAQHGIDVPGEITVVGFDDIPVAGHLSPQLTTVRQPIAELGATAFELLRSVIGNREPENDIVLPTRLMRWASCGCPPGSNVRGQRPATDSPEGART